MSVAYYVVFENGDQPEMCGKALAHASERLNAVSKELGLRPLDDFLGGSSDDLADLLGDEIELPELEARWFSPDEGLALIEAYRKHLDSEIAEALRDDLAQWEEVMNLAKASGVRWHLGLDF
jgi:hypothetical protein